MTINLASTSDPVRVFVSYKKHSDSQLQDRAGRNFVEQMVGFISDRARTADVPITVWFDRELRSGAEWDTAIQGELTSADVFVLVYSPGFFAEDGYIVGRELPHIMERVRQESKSPHGSVFVGTVQTVFREAVPDGFPTAFSDLAKLQAGYEGRPVGGLASEDLAQALLDFAGGVVDACIAAYAKRSTSLMRPKVEAYLERLKRQAKELSSDRQISPEDQLKRPVADLLEAVPETLHTGATAVSTEHRQLPGDSATRVRLDIAVKNADGQLLGHVELKAPDKSGDPLDPKGWSPHDRAQWKKLKDHPNLVYCNGTQWTLFRQGVCVGRVVVPLIGKLHDKSISQLAVLLSDFLRWTPIVPSTPRALAKRLAPLTRLLRDAVAEHLTAHAGKVTPLTTRYQAWGQKLMPGATEAEFADAFAGSSWLRVKSGPVS